MNSDWQLDLIERLAAQVPAAYALAGEPAAEPTALVGLALASHGRLKEATTAALWMSRKQLSNGSVGVTPARPSPGWPTSWALLLWKAIDSATGQPQFAKSIDRALHWSLNQRGKMLPPSEAFGHDSSLVGWSWAADTHSWLEPSALFVLALKATGNWEHARTREAVRLIIDRQLPDGGCNYGNTVVLGQKLLAHLQSTGIAMMALAGEGSDDPRIEQSLSYLVRNLSAETATASLCYALLGLAAHDRTPPHRDQLLLRALDRTVQQGVSPYKLALVGLAAARNYPFESTKRFPVQTE